MSRLPRSWSGVVLLIVLAVVPAEVSADVWDEVVAPVDAARPDPLGEVIWRTDLRAALDEARTSNRPAFVTLRCLPCKQCADFDAGVLEGSPTLTPLLRQFVTVRITDAANIDLSILPAEGYQDFDLSWWGYLLSPDGRVYAVFGGRDHVSDTTRISEAALVNTMRRVLAHHHDPRRGGWDEVVGPAPASDAEIVSPADLPGYRSWRSKVTDEARSCLHCHQVAEMLRQPALDRGQFDHESDLAIWPLPENVGITLDRDHGLLVTAVQAESAAERAGVRSGDELVAANDRRLFGQADFRGVLHRAANPRGSIGLRWLRAGRLMSGALELEDGWRDTELWWRMSVSQGNIGTGPGFAWPHAGPRAGVEPGHMSVKPWFGKKAARSPAFQAGLRPRHAIVAVGEESPDVAGRAFMTWFRLRYDRGDEVVLTVLDGGERREIRYRLPD